MIKNILKSYDYSILIVYIILSIFGLVMVYSASMITAVANGLESDFFYKKQLLNLIIAFVAFLIAAIFPYKIMKSNKFLIPIVFLSLVGLIGLFFFGIVANNAQSWFDLGSRSIQPGEFVKLCVIVYMSAVYAKKQKYIDQFNKGAVPPLVYLVIACCLVAIQPDIGTASIIFAIGCIIVLCSGMGWKNLFKLFMIGLALLLFISPFLLMKKDEILTENRIGRLNSFINPFEYEQTEGYQVVNSYIAIGNGGLTGVGLGKSIQKLGYLPEAHTDFIISIVSEELGIYGVGFVIFSLGFLTLRGFYIGMKCRDPFGSLLAFGVSGMIGIQSFINLGGATGLIPLTGVTLPFVSYGGSSLLVLSIGIGIILNVSMFTNYELNYKKKKVEKEETKTSKIKWSY